MAFLKEEASMSDKTRSTGQSKDATQIDLGDDLLQTKTIQRAAQEKSKQAPSGIDELLVNSKILIAEGFLEEAKSTLRRVLREEPNNLTARDRLEEIQKTEIRRLLGQEENPRSSFLQSKKKPEAAADSPESVLSALEYEVGSSVPCSDQFFRTPEDLGVFMEGLEKLCLGASAQDRLDLGIGFMEMELYDVAVKQFQIASRDAENERKARGLLATALIAQGKSFDAMIELEALVADQSVGPEEKIDSGYLAGVAQENLGNFEASLRWYRAVTQIDPEYRDAGERMRNVQKKCARIPS